MIGDGPHRIEVEFLKHVLRARAVILLVVSGEPPHVDFTATVPATELDQLVDALRAVLAELERDIVRARGLPV
jgi:Erythronolide synthase docking domain